ncbi:MAG: DinB family protein [Acidobacteriota bacterium]
MTSRLSFTVRLVGCLALTALVATPLTAEGFASDFKTDFERTSNKLLDLAEVVPAEEFDHRPTVEVRSVAQSLMHVANANFWLASMLGTERPDDLPTNLEEVVHEKEEVITWLRRSQAAVMQAADAPGDLDRQLEVFGQQRSARSTFMILSAHSHEHVGQLIAYVRGMGLVPPWSQPADDAAADG